MKTLVSCYVLLLLSCHPHVAGQGLTHSDTNIFTRFKLQVFEDEKPTSFFIVGHISISQESGQFKVGWYDVWISPVHSEKKLMLKPEYSSVDLGDIRNVIVADGRFSFELLLEPERMMQVSGTRQTDGSEYQIQGVGLWWIDLLKKTVKTEWRPATKPIVLPYTELF